MATLAQIADFRHAGDALGRLVIAELEAIWGTLDLSDPKQASKALQLILPDVVGDYGDIAATLGADFYEEVTADYGLPYETATLAPVAPAGQTQAVTRWGLTPLFGSNPSAIQAFSFLATGIHRLVLQAGRDTIETNTKRAKLTYARVPSSSEPCAFCLVLASRGAVYGSAKAAQFSAHGSKYHDECRCAPVPMRSDADMPGGYDVAKYERIYEAHASGSLEETTASIREATHAR